MLVPTTSLVLGLYSTCALALSARSTNGYVHESSNLRFASRRGCSTRRTRQRRRSVTCEWSICFGARNATATNATGEGGRSRYRVAVMLQRLDLSNNTFIGRIPDSIANLTNLVFLDVSNNFLSGPVPTGELEAPRILTVYQWVQSDVCQPKCC